MPEPTYVLVVRVWRRPDGGYAARVLGQTEPEAEPSYERAVTAAGVPAAVAGWLALVTER